MTPFLQVVISGMIVAVFSVLITYIITVTTGKTKMHTEMESKILTGIGIHNNIFHQKTIDEKIKEHEDECFPRKNFSVVRDDLNILRIAMSFLVEEAGGDPRKIGLIK